MPEQPEKPDKPDELTILRRRVKAQRRELRRINKQNVGYWAGLRRGIDAMNMVHLREKMIKAFGFREVWKAEHGEYPSGVILEENKNK